MTETTKKSKTGNRYPGVDSQVWKVRTTTDDDPLKTAFMSFTEANTAAARLNLEDGGDFAQAVRA